MKQISCNQCRERWDDIIDKSTFEADSPFADIHAHLENCTDCQKTFELLVAVRQELQLLPTQKAPASLRTNILSQIENPQGQRIPWWHSFFVSPQRLAWASGAIVAVFVVALLMRPERQTLVLQTTPKVLSNRAQVEEHNNSAPLPPSVSSAKPQSDLPAPKVLSDKPRATPLPKSSIRHSQKIDVANKPKQKPATPVLKSAPDKKTELPAPSVKNQLPNPQETPETAKPEVQGNMTPTPSPPTSAHNNSLANEAARVAKSSSDNSMNRQNSSKQPIVESLRDGSMQRYRSQMAAVIHWTRTITSDYDVENAEIVVTLPDGLTFLDDNSGTRERVLWQGRLYRGKEILLDIDLLQTSNETAKLHLLMLNADTRKVLLDKNFDVK